ncbi:pectate lyase, partial [Dickeya dadantii]
MKSLITPITAGLLLALSQPLLAATDTGGYAVTAGGNVTGAVSKTATSMQDIVDIIAAARLDANGKKVKGGAYPLVITYTG